MLLRNKFSKTLFSCISIDHVLHLSMFICALNSMQKKTKSPVDAMITLYSKQPNNCLPSENSHQLSKSCQMRIGNF